MYFVLRAVIFRFYSVLFSPVGLLTAAFGAMVTVFILWVMYNNHDLLYDAISILIIAALASSLAAIVSRVAVKAEAQHLESIVSNDGNLEQALRKLATYLWEKRQTVFTFLTFVFLVSVFNGVVGVSNVMINYLNLDNLKSQNLLLDTQNSMVEAQNDAVLIDAIGRLEERLDAASVDLENLKSMRDAWAGLSIPYYPPEDTRSELDAYICKDAPTLFECFEGRGVSLIDKNTEPQMVGNAIAKGIVWYDLERQAGTNSSKWGVYNEVDHDGTLINWISETRPIAPTVFFAGLEDVCGVTEDIRILAPHMLTTIEKIQEAFYNASTSTLHVPEFAYGMRHDLGDITVDLERLISTLRSFQSEKAASVLGITFQIPETTDDPSNPDTTEAILGALNYIVSAERSLRGMYNQCDVIESRTRERIKQLEAKLKELNERRQNLSPQIRSSPVDIDLRVWGAER